MLLLKDEENGQEVEIWEGGFVYWHNADGNTGCPDWEELSQDTAEKLHSLSKAAHEVMEDMVVSLESTSLTLE